MNENDLPTLQWFPGHMKKAQRLIEENLKSVDIVIEVLDARIPSSSQNPLLKKILGGKPRLIALCKSDLADPKLTDAWINRFRAENLTAVAIDTIKGTGIKNLIAAAKRLAEPATHKLVKHGGKPRAARVMIIGIPNVGKSSLINRLTGGSHTKIENRPGVTRAKQWIRLDGGLELLDTPGILWSKFDDQEAAIKLSWTFALKDEIVDLERTVCLLLETLSKKYPAGLIERFKPDEPLSTVGEELIEMIGRKRGCLKRGGAIDVEKVVRLVLTEFRGGKLGRVTLDPIEENDLK